MCLCLRVRLLVCVPVHVEDATVCACMWVCARMYACLHICHCVCVCVCSRVCVHARACARTCAFPYACALRPMAGAREASRRRGALKPARRSAPLRRLPHRLPTAAASAARTLARRTGAVWGGSTRSFAPRVRCAHRRRYCLFPLNVHSLFSLGFSFSVCISLAGDLQAEAAVATSPSPVRPLV
jgi:hypothetical protein